MSNPDTRTDFPPLQQKDIDRFWSKVDKTPGLGPEGRCWEWRGQCKPPKKAGGPCSYGEFKWSGGRCKSSAHRVAFFLAFGYWPIPMACHHCDNPPCVRPDHLFEGTAKANKEDSCRKRRHAFGSRNGPAKLTEDQVREILEAVVSGLTQQQAARKFAISLPTVGHICAGRTWKHVPRPGRCRMRAKLTEDQVLEIRRQFAEGRTYQVLAVEFGMTEAPIWSICHGKSWKHLPQP